MRCSPTLPIRYLVGNHSNVPECVVVGGHLRSLVPIIPSGWETHLGLAPLWQPPGSVVQLYVTRTRILTFEEALW